MAESQTGVHFRRSKGIINVGSRKSQLALIQTRQVITRLKEFYLNNPDRLEALRDFGFEAENGPEFRVASMTTTGDQILDKPLPAIGTKSLFTKELEVELIERRIDFIVHSLKDMPTTLPDGCIIGAVMRRDDPEDTIVLKKSLRDSMDPLDLLFCQVDGSLDTHKIGTSSQRRIAMIRRCNPKLICVDIRGNLNTRLKKLDSDDSEYTAIILARAGLDRMGWTERSTCLLTPAVDSKLEDWLHAVGQGAIAVECRSDDHAILELIRPIVDLKTTHEVIAERSLMKRLEGGCSVPLGVRSSWSQVASCSRLRLESIVLSTDGCKTVKAHGEVILDDSSESTHGPELVNRVELPTTGIAASQSSTVYNPNIELNMIKCANLGIEVANKMISLGCLELFDRRQAQD